MAKRNSGASPSGRRGSSRGKSRSGSFSRKGEKSSEGPFKKDAEKSADRPERRPYKADKPYGKRPRRDNGSYNSGSSSDGGKSEKPFRRSSENKSSDRRGRPSYGDKPYGKRTDSGAPSRNKPFRKSEEKNDDNRPKRRPSAQKSEFRKSASYGLPYKKSYGKKRESSDRDNRNERDENNRKGDFRSLKKGDPRKNKRDFGKHQQPDLTAPAQTDKIRLNRYIANSGICSRREADELIRMGLISVNGKTITEMGYKVNPGDEVRYENKVLKAEKPVYILMNKPKGYLTTTDDPQERNTIMHLLGSSIKERVYPVGRLDRNTTGLLLLTNDGDLADKLMHPSYNVKKIYKVELDKPLTKGDFQKITDGVHLEEGRAMVDDLAMVSEDGKTVGVELHIGWNRVVRRIFESLGYEVIRLDRSVYAGLDKKELGRGEWRFLKKEEIVHLKHFK